MCEQNMDETNEEKTKNIHGPDQDNEPYSFYKIVQPPKEETT